MMGGMCARVVRKSSKRSLFEKSSAKTFLLQEDVSTP
jgi:hypothetical protein